MNGIQKKLKKNLSNKNLKINEPMSRHTTFGIGGPADFFFFAKTNKDLIKAVKTAKSLSLPFFILGKGSNILVSDKGFRGLVIKNKANKINLKDNCLKANSGVLVQSLVNFAIEESLQGLEIFAGLPGTVGGAIYNNSHFKKDYISDLLTKVEILDEKLQLKEYKKKELIFKYDYSSFQNTKDLIINATFCLRKGNKKKIESLANESRNLRVKLHPLTQKSAGCVFKNPLEKPAGYLIEKAGLKGFCVGKAKVSEKHAAFIINTGEASCNDVLKLIKIIKNKVKGKFKINLKEEIFFIGEQ